jgi:hypothetical protein
MFLPEETIATLLLAETDYEFSGPRTLNGSL